MYKLLVFITALAPGAVSPVQLEFWEAISCAERCAQRGNSLHPRRMLRETNPAVDAFEKSFTALDVRPLDTRPSQFPRPQRCTAWLVFYYAFILAPKQGSNETLMSILIY